MNKNEKKQNFLLAYLKPNLFWYILGAVLISSQSIFQSLLSGNLYRIVIRMGEHKDVSRALLEFGYLAAALILVSAVVMAGHQIYMRACLKTDKSIRESLVRKVLRMFQKDWAQESIGSLAGIFSRDLDIASQSYKKKWTQMLSNVITISVGEILLFLGSPTFGLIFTGFGLIYFFCVYSLKGKVEKLQKDYVRSLTAGSEQLGELAIGLRVVRFYQMENKFHQNYVETVEDNEKTGKALAWIKVCNTFLRSFGYSLMYVGSLAFGLILTAEGKIQLADMMYLWSIGTQVAWNMQNFGLNILSYQENRASTEKVEKVLTLPEEADCKQPLKYDDSDIILKNVSFSYVPEKTILKNIDLTIQQGEKVAIVGASGGGKTTLIKLMMNLYAPTEGVITVGGTDTTAAGLKALRSRFSYLPQSPFLFDDTIESNLKLVKPDASMEEVEYAVSRAGLTSLIKTLPEGLRTIVGDDGSKLSGGERQRMGVARCFLKGGDVYIMDEMTSAMDAKLEEDIIRRLFEMTDKTVICITHKLAAARLADRILVLNEGVIEEDGSHLELLERNGAYAHLVRGESA